MNDMLTFFRNRKEDFGIIRRAKIALPNDVARILVFYAKHEIIGRPELLQDKNFDADYDYEAHKKALADCIARHGGGLWLEQHPNYDGSFLFIIHSVSAIAPEIYHPPKSVFVIAESMDRLDEKPLRQGEAILSLKPDAHAILPVDEDAQAHFIGFRDQFACWFPHDFEISLYNLLCQPSFALRLERLERFMVGERAAPRLLQPPAFASYLSFPATAIGLLAGIAITTALFLSAPRLFSGPQPAQPVQAVEEPQALTVSPAFQSAFNSLMNSLAAATAADSHVQKIWQSYFHSALDAHRQGTGDITLTAEQITDMLKNQDVIWGLLKLQALATYKVPDAGYKFLDTQGDASLMDYAQITIFVFEAIYDPKNQYAPKPADDCVLAFLVNQITADDVKDRFRKNIPAFSKLRDCKLDVAALGSDTSIIDTLKSRLDAILAEQQVAPSKTSNVNDTPSTDKPVKEPPELPLKPQTKPAKKTSTR